MLLTIGGFIVVDVTDVVVVADVIVVDVCDDVTIERVYVADWVSVLSFCMCLKAMCLR